MELVKQTMESLGVLPKLRLGNKIKGGGMELLGSKRVKFLAEPKGISKKVMGKEQKMLRFEVEHEGTRYHWYVRVLNDQGQPNYLLERLAEINVGDERTLEMVKQGMINYTDVREVGASPRLADEDEGEEVIEDAPEEEAKNTAKENSPFGDIRSSPDYPDDDPTITAF